MRVRLLPNCGIYEQVSIVNISYLIAILKIALPGSSCNHNFHHFYNPLLCFSFAALLGVTTGVIMRLISDWLCVRHFCRGVTVSYRSGAMSTGWNGAIGSCRLAWITRKTLSNSDITVASARPQGSTGRSTRRRPSSRSTGQLKGSLVCQI